MEPASALSGISFVLKAAESISKLKNDADKLSPDDARYYAAYLEIASQAIKGLEQEYLEILVQAANCDINDYLQKQRLLTRIDMYITGENLRPKLRDAIEHLSSGREALSQNAERLLVWPTVKSNRREALAEYDRLAGELSGYLGSLGDYSGESAVGLKELRDLKAATADRQRFAELSDRLRSNPDKSSLMYFTDQCARVIEALRIAFR